MPVMKCTLAQLRMEPDNWVEVFNKNYTTPVFLSAFGTIGLSTKPFKIEDVICVIASVEGDNNGSDWVMVGQLYDGRYFKISAGCAYQEGGNPVVSDSFYALVDLGISDEERDRLEIVVT